MSKGSKSKSYRLDLLTDLLSNIEREAEKVVRRFIEKAEQSSREMKSEARKNLSPLFDRAKETARQTKDQVLTVLSIPSQEDVGRLSRKITTLEQKVNKLTRKAA